MPGAFDDSTEGEFAYQAWSADELAACRKDERSGKPVLPVEEVRSVIERRSVVAAQPVEEISFDVARLLPADDAPLLLFGPPASGKSWIALGLCAAIASGAAFLGRYDTRKHDRVLYVNLDAGAKSFRNRVRRIADAGDFDFVTISGGDFTLRDLRELMQDYEGGFVVIDCLANIYRSLTNVDPADGMRNFVEQLRGLFAELHCGGVILDHPHRPKAPGEKPDYYGSIQKEATFRAMWQVESEKVEPKISDTGGELPVTPKRLTISCRKLSEGVEFAPINVTIEFGDRVGLTITNTDVADTQNAIRQDLIAWAKLQQRNLFTQNMAVTNVGGNSNDKRLNFTKLALDKVFVRVGNKGRGAAYLHADFAPPELPPASTDLLATAERENETSSPPNGEAD